jgi:hypothetical protein
VRRAVVAAVVIAGSTGCGGGAGDGVIAREIGWPHGTTLALETYTAPGTVLEVVIERTPIRSTWTCISHRAAARVTGTGRRVVLELADDARRCRADRRPPPMVGGYAEGGGYVGEWSPVAIRYRR